MTEVTKRRVWFAAPLKDWRGEVYGFYVCCTHPDGTVEIRHGSYGRGHRRDRPLSPEDILNARRAAEAAAERRNAEERT
jgi:hypothetical protein